MRKTLILLGGAAVIAALTACGPQSTSGSPAPVNGAGAGATTATDKGSSDSGPLGLAGLAQALNSKTATNTVKMNMTVGGAASISGTGELRFGSDGVAMKETMTTPQGDMDMVLLGKVLYMKIPGLSTGKPWIKIDGNSDDPMAKVLGAITQSAQQNADPTKVLDQIKNAGTITKTSKEQLDGQDTTHYAVTVDVKKMAANQSDPDMKKLMQAAVSGGLTDYPVDLWVNSDGLPVKMVAQTPSLNPTTNKAQNTTTTVTYSDWGSPVDISAPPADQIGALPGH